MAVRAKTSATLAPSAPDDSREASMLLMQLEALGFHRRDDIATSEFKEKKDQPVPVANVKCRVDDLQSKKGRLASRSTGGTTLTAWNTAYVDLENDGTVDQDLPDVNEGLGQTHRIKLQEDDSLKGRMIVEEHFHGPHRGGRAIRGGRGGARNGNFVSRASGGLDRPAPVKKPRVVKGKSVTPAGTSSTLSKAASDGHMAYSQRVSSTKPPSRPLSREQESSSQERTTSRPIYSGQLAIPNNFMANVQRMTAQSDLPIEAPGKGESPMETDLMDLDDALETPVQPVLDFTHPVDNTNKVEESSTREDSAFVTITTGTSRAVSREQSELEIDAQSSKVQSQADPHEITAPRKPTKALKYSLGNLLALRPRLPLATPEAVTRSSAQSPVKEKPVMPLIDTTPASLTEAKSDAILNVAMQQANDRQFIIGEHVYRSTRFQRELLENFGQAPLGLSNITPPTQAPSHSASISTGTSGVFTRGRGVLSAFNGQLRSDVSTERVTLSVGSSATTSPKRPRISMLNRTGFIGLAENQAKGR